LIAATIAFANHRHFSIEEAAAIRLASTMSALLAVAELTLPLGAKF
jgi:hypothetical protein